ncbi:lipase member H-B-like isoform X2 [Coccinella septempunctata]|nr:lipase member H-B-like isoform X2 [Coccinella septempunctata]
MGEILSETKDLMKEYMNRSVFDETQILFYLYKPENNKLITLNFKDVSRTKGKLFLITHGWIEDTTDEDWYIIMAKALIGKFPDSKVVVVDWGSSSNKYLYALSAARTKRVGGLIAKRLVELVVKYKFPVKNIILIGYDLGAHVSGYAGSSFHEATNETLSEIIALDPSGFLFEGKTGEYRLDETDADNVMVVHTSSFLLGYADQCGTIDFYPNGGYSQPGCQAWNFVCNHQRSYQLFISAISTPKAFPTKKCLGSDEFNLGKCVDENLFFGNISETRRGKYYFVTTDNPPYHNLPSRTSKFLRRWG